MDFLMIQAVDLTLVPYIVCLEGLAVTHCLPLHNKLTSFLSP
jgi:hypothetical protein